MSDLTWVEVSKKALTNNIQQIRKIIGPNTIMCPCVKANAYGHGILQTAKTFLEAGANWLGVNSLYEAKALRNAQIHAPIYILGYVPKDSLEEVVRLDCRMVVYNLETIVGLNKAGKAKVHLKVETGNNRQGLFPEDLLKFAKEIKENYPNIEIEGLSTHFANIEDTTDHSYAQQQLQKFEDAWKLLKDNGIEVPIRHCANSAATILFNKTHFEMVRPGIITYGMWPSKETSLSFKNEVGQDFPLMPALTWKTKIAQTKWIPENEFIGYGCTYKTSHETRLAIIPVGYYDGYDRGISDGYVLIHGRRAPIRGRICMNILMAEITDIPEAKLEDEVVLMGKDGTEEISAEQFAAWAGTINYEVTTRINGRIPRIIL